MLARKLVLVFLALLFATPSFAGDGLTSAAVRAPRKRTVKQTDAPTTEQPTSDSKPGESCVPADAVTPGEIGDGIVADDAFANPDPDGHRKIIEALSNEKTKKIQMWMFSMSNPAVIKALTDAAGRGVDVTVIFNGAMFEGSEAKIPEQLTSGGVKVLRASSKFSITHAKTFVVNGGMADAYAWIMSLNTTQNFPNQADFAVRTSDKNVISELLTLYKDDMQNSADKTCLTTKITDPNLVVSPVNSYERLVALLNTARTSIDLTVENLSPSIRPPQGSTTKDIVSTLVAKINSGIKVRVITPSCDMNPSNVGFNLTASKTLNDAGLARGNGDVARVMPYPGTPDHPYVHQKLIIIDGQKFYVGSENFSANSLESAREIGVIVKVQGAASIVQQDFDAEWGTDKPTTWDQMVEAGDNIKGAVVPPESMPRNCDAFGHNGATAPSEAISKNSDEENNANVDKTTFEDKENKTDPTTGDHKPIKAPKKSTKKPKSAA